MDIKNNPQKFLYLTLSIALLLVSCSISYYYLIILPDQNNRKIEIAEEEFRMKKDSEERKIEAEKAKVLAEELEENRKEIDKEACLSNAIHRYSEAWKFSCTQWKKEVDKSWNNCIATVYSWQTPEERKAECKRQTPDYEKDDNGQCLLPSKYSDDIESSYKSAKQECNTQ